MSKCSKCNTSPCCCDSCSTSSIKQMRSDLDSMLQYMDEVQGLTRFLSGHPIMAVEDASDVAMFDLSTGKGTGIWTGWGICNGNNYPGAGGKQIATPDLRDKFIAGSQGSYAVGNQGGANSVTLSAAEMPTHNHVITDPGHTHPVTDPGHTHTGTTANHNHASIVDVPSTTSVVKASSPALAGVSPTTITTNPTGVSISPDVTNLSLAAAGGNTAHENRPPYYAVLFIKRIY